jgi:intracellular multiplication protein IcmK
MKKILCAFVVTSMLGAASAHAQVSKPASPSTDAQDSEFAAFRAKLEEAQAAAAPAATAPAPVSPLAVPLEGAPTDAGTASGADELSKLLGPAGNLPLDGKSPAVAPNGMIMQTPEELRMVMEQEAELQKQRLEDETFEAALKMLMPMTPEQIRKTYDAFIVNRRAAETPAIAPEPRQVVETISLDPGGEMTTVKMTPGFVTTVVILDASGAPWPVENLSWAGAFDVTPPESGGNIIRFTPQSAHGVGNISIKLVDLIAPITMNLRSNIEEVYYRMDLRVPKAGPLAKTPLIEYGGLKAVAGKDKSLSAILDGIPPEGAEKLLIDGVDGRTSAWRVEDAVYLRTPLSLLSPGWHASATSADGMNVYALSKAPVVLLSDGGRMVRARIDNDGVAP